MIALQSNARRTARAHDHARRIAFPQSAAVRGIVGRCRRLQSRAPRCPPRLSSACRASRHHRLTRAAIDDPAAPVERATGRSPLPAALANRSLQHGLALAGDAGGRHLRRGDDGLAGARRAARHPAHAAARRVRLHRRHLRRPPGPARPPLRLARRRDDGLARRSRPRALRRRRLLARGARDLPLGRRLDHGHAGQAAPDRRTSQGLRAWRRP